ncbi:MAG TPA: methyltransferase domain-containing protein [Opitutaceae bacterium]|nr:methyltransferase domain-containing protein [Opitutaceae bacterium]
MSEVSSNEPRFWDQRYETGRMAWDCGGVPRALTEFLRCHPAGGRALVPGCGSGYEIQAFHAAGWKVLGLDFSRAAVARARRTLGPLGDRIHEGDFFTHPLDAGSFDLVYERTFLCALPPTTWTAFARRMAGLLAPGGLLCGFFFFGPEEEPPPYPISPQELDRLLGADFAKTVDEPVVDSLPLYAGKERWQVWRRRDHAAAGGNSGPT